MVHFMQKVKQLQTAGLSRRTAVLITRIMRGVERPEDQLGRFGEHMLRYHEFRRGIIAWEYDNEEE